MKRLLLGGFILFTFNLLAQVGPYSNGTLVASSEQGVDSKTLEVQTGYESYYTSKTWDADRKLTKSDTMNVETGASIQFNSGITDNIEWGVVIPFDASEMSLGLKYNFLQKDSTRNLGLSVGAWTDVPLGTGSYKRFSKDVDNNAVLGGTFIGSYKFSEKLVSYADVSVTKSIVKNPNTMNLYLNGELLYAVKEGHHWIAGISYSTAMYEDNNMNQDVVALSVGPVLELWENWNLTLFTTIDLAGKNTTRGKYFSAVFCTIF